jgi:dTDP-4-dehydrorhamnose 3,5-epimerase
MDLRRLSIPDVLVLRPRRHADDRGYFMESYSCAAMATLGLEPVFVQDNLSLSRQVGTLRGLHYQRPPKAQAKLIQVIQGRILDVAVDVRRGSPTYGRHAAVELSADSGEQVFVPSGFLHGFVTLEQDTLVLYKVDAPYAPECEGSVRWDDADLGIDWGVSAGAATLSAKDAAAPAFADFDSPFVYAEPEGGRA